MKLCYSHRVCLHYEFKLFNEVAVYLKLYPSTWIYTNKINSYDIIKQLWNICVVFTIL